jgi:F-type H+-transporting ATPase subunit delta
MQGSSTGALAAVVKAADGQLSQGADAATLGEELFSLARALDGAHSLRRALTEPAVPKEAKARLLRSLFGDRLTEPTLAVAEEGTGRRWSSTRDFPDALEQASVTAQVARADADGRLDSLEDNLFRFARISEASPALRDALGDMTTPWEAKRRLVQNLVGDKVDDATAALLSQAVAGRHRSLTSVLATYQRVAAARRDSMIATVWVAAPLSDEHRDRLAQALSRQQDKRIHLNVVVDPTVLGGVRVSVGDEVIDSTVETRLKQAQRRLER